MQEEVESRALTLAINTAKLTGRTLKNAIANAYRTMFRQYPDVVSVEQMSEMLGVSSKTGYRLLRENSIAHFRVGRSYRIPKLHILSYLQVISGS